MSILETATILDDGKSLMNSPMSDYDRRRIGSLFIGRNAELQNKVSVYNDSGSVVGKKLFRQMTDVEGSIFFARQLEFIQQQIFEVEFTPLKFRELFPVLNLENAGYTSHTYTVEEQFGRAKIIGNNSNDIPLAHLAGKQVTTNLKTAAIGYRLTQQDMASSNLIGLPLAQRKALAARRGMEQLLNNIAIIGDNVHLLGGLLTNPDISVGNVASGAGGTPQWSTKTPDEILKDLNDAYSEVVENSKENHRPNTILLPIEQFELIRQTARSANSDTTIMQYFQRNNPEVKFISVPQLDGAGAVPGTTDVMVVYERDPMNMEFVMGLEQTFLEPQVRNLELMVPSWATTAGLVVMRPLSAVIKEEI